MAALALPDLVAEQFDALHDQLVSDLNRVPRSRVLLLDYNDYVAGGFKRLASELTQMGVNLPLARKVDHKPQSSEGGTSAVADPPAANDGRGLLKLLEAERAQCLVSSYGSGMVATIRNVANEAGLPKEAYSAFESPTGIAQREGRLAVADGRQVWFFARRPSDAIGNLIWAPSHAVFTGAIEARDISFDRMGNLWVASARFSCLGTIRPPFSFEPRWTPGFITETVAEDRCHLNGLAMRDGEPAYVTALGATDTPSGWRDGKGNGGILVDVNSNEIIASGLCMPHSPRLASDQLLFLQSGLGQLMSVDLSNGAADVVAEVPGFARGMAILDGRAIIGLSRIRATVFRGLPITEVVGRQRCGLAVVDISSGRLEDILPFDPPREVFDVSMTEGNRSLVSPDDESLLSTFYLPVDAAGASRTVE